MRHLRLVGAGHAHLVVLLHLKKQRLAKQWPNNTEVSLICAERYQRYSGMLPAWMAGYATEAEMSIDIAPLCAAAGVTWIQEDLVSMEAAQGYLSTALSDFVFIAESALSFLGFGLPASAQA